MTVNIVIPASEKFSSLNFLFYVLATIIRNQLVDIIITQTSWLPQALPSLTPPWAFVRQVTIYGVLCCFLHEKYGFKCYFQVNMNSTRGYREICHPVIQ